MAFEKFSPEKFQEDITAAVEAGDYERVMELFDSAPEWMKKQVEFSLFRASVLISLGDLDGALRLLLALERKNPSMLEIQGLLALLYMDLEFPAHALQAARRGLAARNLGVDELDNLNQLIPAATAILQKLADQFGVSLQTMQQAAIFNEKSLMA
ncbi:MAG TPA: tetratricopeptide repeat protein, partial [Anaerolinea sp.]|nr:tetratricopeptide repeat protein [Anaerolinea sp.]